MARAQYAYPSGYGGWVGADGGICIGRWLDGTKGHRPRPGGLRRRGWLYNKATAVARSMNTDTASAWNNYVYASQLEADRRRTEGPRRRARREPQAGPRQSHPGGYQPRRCPEHGPHRDQRLKHYLRDSTAAGTEFPGESIRDIPFQHAASALTASVHGLALEHAPAVLKDRPEFETSERALRTTADQIRKEDEEEGHLVIARRTPRPGRGLREGRSPCRGQVYRGRRPARGLLLRHGVRRSRHEEEAGPPSTATSSGRPLPALGGSGRDAACRPPRSNPRVRGSSRREPRVSRCRIP